MQSYLKVGEFVQIDTECKTTKRYHGLHYTNKIAMLGTKQRIDKVRDMQTIVIKDFHFHPIDLRPILSLKEREIPKKKYTPVFFDVKELI